MHEARVTCGIKSINAQGEAGLRFLKVVSSGEYRLVMS